MKFSFMSVPVTKLCKAKIGVEEEKIKNQAKLVMWHNIKFFQLYLDFWTVTVHGVWYHQRLL